MYWVDIIKDIYRTLDAHGLHDMSYEIGEEHVKGGTPGEMFTLVVAKLISIKENQPEVYALIKEETEWMIAYAKKIHYL
jgi:hypothetical protein